jgi:hypothetical protein
MTTTTQSPETCSGLMTEREFSALSRLALGTLRNWRCRRVGPPWRKLGSRILYGPEAVRWLEAQTQTTHAAA